MKDIYSEVAQSAARFTWQTISTLLPQVGVWYAANKTGDIADWALGHKKQAEEKQSFFSRLNPLSALKSLNPVSLLSFVARPFSSVKKAVSWFFLEEVAYEMNEKIKAPLQKVAPIAEEFLTPIFKKFTTPAVNFLKDNGLMQFPKPDIVCPSVCGSVLKEVSRQAVLPETQNSFRQAWNYLTQPILDLTGSAVKAAKQNPTPIHEVFAEPIKKAAKTHVPQGYLERAEQYAGPAGDYVADAISAVYKGAGKAVQKPGEITHAVNEAAQIIADALGVHPGWIIGAGVGVAGLASYGIYSGLHGWHNNTAVANAHAQANGGQATGNNVNLTVHLTAPQGGAAPQANDAAPAMKIIEVPSRIDGPKK